MFSSKNIICSDLAEGRNITATEQFNIGIVSANLADFNYRFKTDIVLHYNYHTAEFGPSDKEDMLAQWFCDGIKELIRLANSQANNSKEYIEKYLDNRRIEVEHLRISSTIGSYSKRYHDHSPLGFLSYENEQYVKSEMNAMLF